MGAAGMAEATPQLIVQLEGQTVDSVAITTETVTLGRAPGNGLVLPHPLVSRRHAEIRRTPSGAFLTDLESTSGTFINGVRLLPNQPQPLSDGAVFQIGPFMLAYRAAPPAAAPDSDPEAADQPLSEADLSAADLPAELWEMPPALALPLDPAPTGEISPPRPRLLAQRATGPHSTYLQDLPVVYHDNDFLGRYLLIFETIWEPLEQRQDYIDMYFDPRTCPATLLPWLASWLELSFEQGWPEARLRHLLTEIVELYRWRGTRYGLTRILELCTGLMPEITEDPVQPFVFHVRIAISGDSGVDRQLIESLIRMHKPAHVGYTLELRPV
jgi:phage tail-like protein